MSWEYLNVRHSGHIAWVEFARPNQANALNYQHLQEIEQAAKSFRDDDTTRVVIFTGQGKHFSGGADLNDPGSEYHGTLALRRRRLRIGERAIEAVRDMDQITIAAWNGGALGGGACLATAMDFRIGAEDCFMAYPEIDLGINLMWKSLPLIVDLAGAAVAKRLVIGGERMYAPELVRFGILDQCVAADELANAAVTLAETYASKSPVAAQMIKRSINTLAAPLGNAIMHMDADQNLLNTASKDRAEAVRAYQSKTSPDFSGD